MEVKDLSKEQLLQERTLIKEKIAKLRNQRKGLDGQIDTEYLRKTEIEEEIIRRYEND